MPTKASNAASAPFTGLISEEIKQLSTACIESKTRAYCPYSQFRVGCTILLKSSAASTTAWKDRLIKGANVENASYPVGTCAERVALGTAIVQGVKYGDIKAIAVATDIKEFCSPCGMCRQFMREFCEQDMPVVMHNCDGETKTITMAELLPLSFGPNVLPSPDELVRMRSEHVDMV